MIAKKLIPIGAVLAGLAACNSKPATNTTATNTMATDTAGNTGAPGGPAAQTADAAGRVRGAVTAVTGTGVTIQSYGGQSVTVPIDAKTGFAWVARSNLASLKTGDFIGTATTGPDTALRAVELVIFPESMRGTGEGHYGWDTPGVVAATGGGAASSSAMTNGTVQQQSAMTNGTVQEQSAMTNGTVQGQSAMTNGTVSGATGGAGDKTLTVTYKGGKSQILVPAGTPVVRFEPAQKSILAVGQKVFAVSTPDAKPAKFVAVGKFGTTPPM
ncbi:MAG: hypothetical protein ACRYFW_06050 [Janthinobacterium lividum]